MKTMEIRIKEGQIRFIHNDDLAGRFMKQGAAETRRASHVEPDGKGGWIADLSPVAPGVVLGPFARRDVALQQEVDWLLSHRIPIPQGTDHV